MVSRHFKYWIRVVLAISVSDGSKFYTKIVETVNGTRRFLSDRSKRKGGLCSLKSVIRGSTRLSELISGKLIPVSGSSFGRVISTAKRTLLVETRNRPPRACSRTGTLKFRVVSYAYPIILGLRRSVGGTCLTRERRNIKRVVVFKGVNRTRILKLVNRASKETMIIRGLPVLRNLVRSKRFHPSIPARIFDRAAGDPTRCEELYN